MSDDPIEISVPAATATLQPTSRWLEVNVIETGGSPQWRRAELISESWVDGRTLWHAKIVPDGSVVQLDDLSRMRLVSHECRGGTVDMRVGPTPGVS